MWQKDGLLYCAGTHEYRPMGTAVISEQDLFRPRDFSPRRKSPVRGYDGFVGYFASLGDVNQFLQSHRGKKLSHIRDAHRILRTFGK